MSDLELSQEKKISVVRQGISIGELEESFSIMSTKNNALVFDRFVHSVISLKNHESTTPVPKNMLKRKADEELAIPSGTHEKRPRMECNGARLGGPFTLDKSGVRYSRRKEVALCSTSYNT